MDRKSLESVVSINVSMSNIWVTRCRRLALRKNLLILQRVPSYIYAYEQLFQKLH